MANDIAHFAIHADDCQRAKKFYESVFGWKFEPWGPPDFWLIETSPGALRGALQKRRQALTNSGINSFECSIAVADIQGTLTALKAHGATITMPPFLIEGVGTLVMFLDSEGNSVGAMQYLEGIR